MMQLETKRLGERATRWLLRNESQPLDITAVVDRYRPVVEELRAVVGGLLPDADQRSVSRTTELIDDAGFSGELAEAVAHMGLMITALDIAEIQERTRAPIERTSAAYFALDESLALAWMRDRIIALPRTDRWQSLARSALRDDFFRAHAELAESVVATAPMGADTENVIDAWLAARAVPVEHCLAVLSDIRATGRADLAQLSVALRELRNLIHIAR
jgi:glutamate dehydrogenase